MKKCFLGVFAAASLLAAVPANAGDIRLGGDITFVGYTGRTMSGDPLRDPSSQPITSTSDWLWLGRPVSTFDPSSKTTGQYKPFDIQQMIHMSFEYVASEDLSGYINLQAGDVSSDCYAPKWGTGSKMMDPGNNNFWVKNAWIDWRVPNTKAKVRIGLQPLYMPMATWYVGNPYYTDQIAGVTVNLPVSDAFSLTTGYYRVEPSSHELTSGGNLLYAAADYHAGGLTFQPYFTWSNGAFIQSLAIVPKVDRAFGIGAAAKYKMEQIPLTFSADFLYTEAKNFCWSGFTSNGMVFSPIDGLTQPANLINGKGWFLSGSVSYQTKYGAPTLLGWYTTGDKAGQRWREGQVFSYSGSTYPTSVYFGRGYTDSVIGYDGTYLSGAQIGGTAGLVAEWSLASFTPGLLHTARVAYVKGTNSTESVEALQYGGHPRYMTTEDHFWEADLDTLLFLDKQLYLTLQLGYLWEGFKNPDYKNAWKVGVTAKYTF